MTKKGEVGPEGIDESKERTGKMNEVVLAVARFTRK
jgi:hypothetical protein